MFLYTYMSLLDKNTKIKKSNKINRIDKNNRMKTTELEEGR